MDEKPIKEKVLDEWEIELKKQKKILETHMKKLGITSAMDCPDFPNCKVQEKFEAVYNSMSKGAGGGFEF